MTDNNALAANEQTELYYLRNKHSGYLGNAPIWWGAKGGYTAYINGAKKFTKEEIEQKEAEDSSKWKGYKCKDIDARLHLVFDHQNESHLGTNAPSGWSFDYASYQAALPPVKNEVEQKLIHVIKAFIAKENNPLIRAEAEAAIKAHKSPTPAIKQNVEGDKLYINTPDKCNHWWQTVRCINCGIAQPTSEDKPTNNMQLVNKSALYLNKHHDNSETNNLIAELRAELIQRELNSRPITEDRQKLVEEWKKEAERLYEMNNSLDVERLKYRDFAFSLIEATEDIDSSLLSDLRQDFKDYINGKKFLQTDNKEEMA